MVIDRGTDQALRALVAAVESMETRGLNHPRILTLRAVHANAGEMPPLLRPLRATGAVDVVMERALTTRRTRLW